MRTLIFSDLHDHNYQEFSTINEGVNSRLLEHLLCLDLIAEDALKLKVDVIVFGGDIFHLKNFVDSQVIKLTMKKMEELSEIAPIVICPGNHDYRGWGSDPILLEILSEFSGNIHLPTIGTHNEVTCFGWTIKIFPFTRDIDSLNDQLKAHPRTSKTIAILHQDMIGSMYGKFLVEKGLYPELLADRFPFSFVGHFHDQKSMSPTVWSIGSPLMLSFGEQDQGKGWLFLDTDEGVVKQLLNTVSPRFRTAIVEVGDELPTISDEEAARDFFRFIIKGSTIPDLSRFHWKRVKVEAVSDKKKRTSISFSDSTLDLITKYVKSRGTDLDENLLIETGRRYLL
jgi:DNA repair exonuclease SbcCD nuclease subunit